MAHFCLTATYTPQALSAILDNPNSNRRAAIEDLMKAAGGKLVAFYRTVADGVGVHCIVDVDPMVAPAIVAIVQSTGALSGVHLTRLFTDDETTAVRKTISTIRGAYKPPGQ